MKLASTCLIAAAAALLAGCGMPPGVAGHPQSAPTASSSVRAVPRQDERALCGRLSPLMAESVAIGKQFVGLGPTGSPARDAGIPVFRAQVEGWAGRVQAILDADADPPTFLTRTAQRYVDDLHAYAANIRPGPEVAADRAAWYDGTVAYGGPMAVCDELGVRWW